MYQSFQQQQSQMFRGEVPIYNSNMGQPIMQYPGGMGSNFMQTQRTQLSNSWAPNRPRQDPPQMMQLSEIHQKDTGHIPYYTGHIPGAKFRSGKTFGNDSKDAKRWIRGDHSL